MRKGDWESVFGRLEELVLANSGEDAFEEIFKLLIAKLWDETKNGNRAFGVADGSTGARSAINALLKDAESQWPEVIPKPIESRLTDAHLAVCVTALCDQQLSETSFEVMDGVFEFLVNRASKGAKGQYFTPRHVVDFCVRMLNPQPHELVCDPACGSGGFLVHTMQHVRGNTGNNSGVLKDYCETALWGFDFDARAVRVAKALMLFAGDGKANIYRINSLLNPFTDLFLQDQTGQPFLTIENVMRAHIKGFKGFDAIVTNPPFAGEIKEKHILTSYSLYKPERRLERDVLFLERCAQLLKPGGRIAIVLPHNKLGTSSWTYLREWLMRELQIIAVIGLGRHTFLPHTHQKTSVLIGIRRSKTLKQIPPEEIFFGVSERDGKDSKGQYVMLPKSEENQPLWNRCDHDLSEIHAEFGRYCIQHGIEWGAKYGSNLS